MKLLLLALIRVINIYYENNSSHIFATTPCMFISHRYCSGQFDPAVKLEVKGCQNCQTIYLFTTVRHISPKTHTHTHTHTRARTHAHTRTHTHTHTHTRAHTHRCKCCDLTGTIYVLCSRGKTPPTFSGHSTGEGQNISNIICMGFLPTLHSVRQTDLYKMSSRNRWMTVQQARDFVIDHDSEIEEEVSEDEDDLELNSDSNDSDFEPDEGIAIPIPPSKTFMSKNSEIQWSSSPNIRQTRMSAENIIKTVPGPTRMAVTRVTDIKSAFELVMPNSIQKIILEMTNLEGRRVFGEKWKELDKTHLDAYLGLLILAGVYKSKDESTASLWGAETGRAIFRATMSLETFHIFSRVIRFDNRETRAGRRERDKLAAVRTVWDKWVEQLPLLYNPGPNITVDERLVAFRGRCPFRQYMPSKPAKYGIKIWAACDAKTSYALNMQVYTGKAVGGAPEKNQGSRVVLDMAHGLRGHNITCDNFFTNYNLGQELLKRKLTMVGTVRKNRVELPAELLVIKNRAAQSSMFAFTDTTALVSYCPKKGKNLCS